MENNHEVNNMNNQTNLNTENNAIQENKTNNKNNKVLIIIIVILTILLIGVISFVVYDKVLTKEEVKTEEKKSKEDNVPQEDKIISITESEVNAMMEQIKEYNARLSEYYPINDINQIDPSVIVNMAYLHIPNIGYGQNQTFMETDLEKVTAKYFGNEYKVTHQDVTCFCEDKIMYKYNSAKSNYTFYGLHGHGGASQNEGYSYFIDGTFNETQNTYTINAKTIYRTPIQDTVGPTTHYYGNGKDARNETNPIYTVSEHEIETLQPETVYNNVKEQLKITSYEFKVDSEGNYGLTKVTIK